MNSGDGLGPWIVFDVGGTKLRAAIYHPGENSLSSVTSRPTPSHWNFPGQSTRWIQRRLLEQMRDLAASLSPQGAASVVSVAFPGPVGPGGEALSAPTIWGEGDGKPFEVLREVRGLWPSARVFVMNDVTAAGYYYLRESAEDFCVVTVSSGIGLKVFIAGRPVVGPAGRGGEIGHVRVDFSSDPPVCDCRGLGHLGAISSGRGTLMAARRLANASGDGFSQSLLADACDPLENQALVEAFHGRDPWACRLIRRTAMPLGQMLAAVHAALGIERFIIIGGFALALGEEYRKELVAAAAACYWQLGQDWGAMIALGEPHDRMGLLRRPLRG